MIELYWPVSNGEWLAWSVAAATGFFGLVMLFAPRYSLRLLRLRTSPDRPEAVSEVRATMAGFYIGLGGACILLHPQPLLYLTLAAAWAFAFFGRLLSIMSDRGNTPYNWVRLLIETVFAILPGGHALGFW